MIKLQLNKFKVVALIRVSEQIIHRIKSERQKLQYSMKRAELSAHLFILQSLNRKVRSKFISIEDKPDHQNFFFSVDEMQAYVLMIYKDAPVEKSDYDYLTMQDLSVPIFKKLLN